jgi:subtilase family serine protease
VAFSSSTDTTERILHVAGRGGWGYANLESWTPSDTGRYEFHARIDPMNAVAETDESDNQESLTVWVTPLHLLRREGRGL